MGVLLQAVQRLPTLQSLFFHPCLLLYCSHSINSYDLEFPLEVDDEYWLHPDPEQAFKQPVGKPSTVSFWVHLLRLLDTFGVAQRSIVRLASAS